MRFVFLLSVVACTHAPDVGAPPMPDNVPSMAPEVPAPSTPGPTEPTPTDSDDAVDCGPIAADPGFELCEETDDRCAGVFTDGSGCEAFCNAAGLVCVARYGGEPGCQVELDSPLPCGAETGHQSDWCECARAPEPGDCDTDPSAVQLELGLADAVFTQRHNWVVDCREYAYTASGDEHEACDATYAPDGSRRGTATFTFTNVPRGTWEVYVGGRHTENRNPSGALFLVNGVATTIDQTDPSGDLVWDLHGTHCLDGTVEVTLDSSVNSGSDAVFGARLVPIR